MTLFPSRKSEQNRGVLPDFKTSRHYEDKLEKQGSAIQFFSIFTSASKCLCLSTFSLMKFAGQEGTFFCFHEELMVEGPKPGYMLSLAHQ